MNKITLHNQGIILNGNEINWGEERNVLREKLALEYKIGDRCQKFSDSYEYKLKRDMFSGFFVNYDFDKETFKEIEIHADCEITISNHNLKFCIGDSFSKVQTAFSKFYECVKIGNENLLIKELKLTFASDKAMGGDSKNIRYVYMSNNIHHLL